MKKYIAFLLCLMMILSLFSCDTANKIKDTENDTDNTEALDKDDSTKDSEPTDKPTTDINKQYYKIEEIELTKVRYYIYDSNGNTVLSDETDRPLDISMLGDNIVDICISMGAGINIHKYYDVQNNRFSEEYSYVAASSGNLVAYIEGRSLSDRKLVVRDIFDKNAFYKSFGLDFSPTVHDPIESATFTDGEAELKLVYLSERPPVSLSITLPIRRASNEGEILSQTEIAIKMYEAAINGEICVFDEHLGEIKLKACRFPSNNLRVDECEILSKAILDMDGDGINEYVIQSEEKDHIVLHYYNGKVYSYCFDMSNFYNLNTDGSFYWSDSYESTNCTRGHNQIAFDGSSLSIKEIYRIKQTSPYDYGDDDQEYYVNGKQITRKEFRAYYDSNCRSKTRATFSPLDISCEYPISSEKAFELASNYWGFKSGTEDGTAGTLYVLEIVILEKPNNDTQSYRIGCQAEGYTTHVIDSCYAQPPKSVRMYKELFVDAITGECRDTEAEIAMKMYEAFLKNEIASESGYLKNHREEYLMDYLWERNGGVRYAYVDMDGDGQVELLVSGIDTFVFSYLHEINAVVSISLYNFREMNRVYVDGSYSWNYPSSDGVSYGLKKDGKDIWRIENEGGSYTLYYIGEESVTQAEMLKYLEENPSPEEVTFTSISGEGWNKVIDEERAEEIASEYWNIKDGDINEQTGKEYSIYVSSIVGERYYIRLRLRSGYYYEPDIASLYIDAITGKIISDFLPDGKG